MRGDTIAAIATSPSGVGGIGIVRISGEHAEEICRRLFRPSREVTCYESHRLYHGHIVDIERDMIIDEGLVALMRAPHSYTGEDVLEISCHGNPLILKSVLDLALKAGSRPAEPGEFTKRAFLNNRIDLAQAEAVADLVSAGTERGLQQALQALRGGLSAEIRSFRVSLADVLAAIETHIDFSEEDIELPSLWQYIGRLEEAAAAMAETAATYDKAIFYRDGVTAVIIGRPNVGKSSLLNCLAGRRRAIVAVEPGTTRDFIEAEVLIGDIRVRFVDTAGIRDSDHPVEAEGVLYARERADDADLVLVVIDGSGEFTREDSEIIEAYRAKNMLVVVNKDDLTRRLSLEDLERVNPGSKPVFVSAKENRGMEELRERIGQLYDTSGIGDSDVMLTNLRHKEAVEVAAACVERAVRNLKEGASPELPALEISEALRHLALITGEEAGEDILDIIFSRFCVGK